MRELSLHILDIAENSVSAKSKNIHISVIEDPATDRLAISIEDDGVGMDEEMVKKVTDPFVTSRTTRKVGLGLSLLKENAEACNGHFQIHSVLGKGTKVDVDFQNSHIDRMPLGDLPGTWLSLLVGFPAVHWVFRFEYNQSVFEFDDEPIKNTLQDIPLSEPEVLSYLRQELEQGINQLKIQAASQI